MDPERNELWGWFEIILNKLGIRIWIMTYIWFGTRRSIIDEQAKNYISSSPSLKLSETFLILLKNIRVVMIDQT